MSEPVNALGGARFDGIVQVTEVAPQGMITVRGDLGAGAMEKAVMKAAGLPIPAKTSVVMKGDHAVLWMSPDELMVVLPHGDAPAAVAAMTAALKSEHALVVDVSDARAVFALEGEGPALRETLAKLSPADMRSAALPVGVVRRTRLAQVPAAFWFANDTEARLICFRSVASYVFGILSHAATPGSEVGHFS